MIESTPLAEAMEDTIDLNRRQRLISLTNYSTNIYWTLS
jgi:hypothetical protein